MPADLAKKLNLKPDQPIAVVAAPEGISLDLSVASDDRGAVMVFVRDKAALDAAAGPAIEAARADRLAWIAYPKGGALGTDLNRDILAQLVIERGARPVRQVSIDDTWSALRFRPSS